MLPFVFFVGVCRNCRVLLAKMESKEEPEVEREVTTEEFAGGTEVLFPMENLSLVQFSSVQFSLFLPFQLYVYIYIYKYPNYEI